MLNYDERYHNQTCENVDFAKIYKFVEIREILQNPQTFTKPRWTQCLSLSLISNCMTLFASLLRSESRDKMSRIHICSAGIFSNQQFITLDTKSHVRLGPHIAKKLFCFELNTIQYKLILL
jgi:hypothetical protein